MSRKLSHQEIVCNVCSLKHEVSKDDYDASVFIIHSNYLLSQLQLQTLLRTFGMML